MSRIQLTVFVVLALVTIGFVLVFLDILPGGRQPKPPEVTLEFWGVEEDGQVWPEITNSYTEKNSHVSINYTKFNPEEYEAVLIDRLAEGSGPDIFVLKNSWIEKHQDKIFPLPQNELQFFAKDLKTAFADVAGDDLITAEGKILGLPLFIDTPALFYNKDIFNSSAVALPPKNWDEVVKISQNLTQLTPAGDIIRSGLALGTFKNVEYATEILTSLILQNGDSIIKNTGEVEIGRKTEEAVLFYTSFADPTKSHFSWTSRVKNSLDALADGTATMAIAFPGDLKKIKAKNPHFELGISSFPQLKDTKKPVVYGSYFFPTVSKSSPNPLEAWKFLIYITSFEPAQKYLERTARIPARRDLVARETTDNELDVFYKQSLIAKSWPTPNEETVKKLFGDMIESVVLRTSDIGRAISNFRQKIEFFMFR